MVPFDVKYTETLGSPFISFYELLMINTLYNCLGNVMEKECDGKPLKCGAKNSFQTNAKVKQITARWAVFQILATALNVFAQAAMEASIVTRR